MSGIFRPIDRSWVLSITSEASVSVQNGIWDMYDTPEKCDLIVFLPHLWNPPERFCSCQSPFLGSSVQLLINRWSLGGVNVCLGS
jgi:hypothetical protein